MLATSHALLGAALVKTLPDPQISFPLAILSHFILDLIPHWDLATGLNNRNHYDIKKRQTLQIIPWAVLDVVFGLSLVLFLFKDLPPSLLLGAVFFAQLPDWLEAPYFLLGIRFPPSVVIKKFQGLCHAKLALPWGILTQLLIVLPLIWWTR